MPVTLKIKPGKLRGSVNVPPSKSMSHRLLIAAALSPGKSRIDNLAMSEDIEATLGCIKTLGAEISRDGGTWYVGGAGPQISPKAFYCGESGSTLRFMMPVSLALCGGGEFCGRGRLLQRSNRPLFEMFDEVGIRYYQNGTLKIEGELKSGVYRLRGDVSSQYITGLLFALPLLEGESIIELTTPLESRPYVDMTIEALRTFGIRVTDDAYRTFTVPGGQFYRAGNHTVEGDYSQAAFYLTANALGSEVQVDGLPEQTSQADRQIVQILEQLKSPGEVRLDMSDAPDIVPITAVAASLRAGSKTIIENAGRLRHKESDRLEAVSAELMKLGGQVSQTDDGLEILGVRRLRGGRVSSRSDHRIAMSLAVAATCCDDAVILENAHCVNKSYVEFWKDYVALGGAIIEV